MQDPSEKTPVIVAGKDVAEVDNDYFLLPVSILDHEGPLRTAFPVENRLLPQGEWVGRAWVGGWVGRARACGKGKF